MSSAVCDGRFQMSEVTPTGDARPKRVLKWMVSAVSGAVPPPHVHGFQGNESSQITEPRKEVGREETEHHR